MEIYVKGCGYLKKMRKFEISTGLNAKNDKNLSSKTQIIIERKNVIYKLDPNVELIEF